MAASSEDDESGEERAVPEAAVQDLDGNKDRPTNGILKESSTNQNRAAVRKPAAVSKPAAQQGTGTSRAKPKQPKPQSKYLDHVLAAIAYFNSAKR
jgi:hypothetical protein